METETRADRGEREGEMATNGCDVGSILYSSLSERTLGQFEYKGLSTDTREIPVSKVFGATTPRHSVLRSDHPVNTLSVKIIIRTCKIVLAKLTN